MVRPPTPILRQQRQRSGKTGLRFWPYRVKQLTKPLADPMNDTVVVIMFFGIGMSSRLPVLLAQQVVSQDPHVSHRQRQPFSIGGGVLTPPLAHQRQPLPPLGGHPTINPL